MQDVNIAFSELEQTIRELELKGNEMDHRKLRPFYEKVQELDLLIAIHPPNVVAGADRMRRYWLSNLIGNSLTTSQQRQPRRRY